ncbi:Bug family tripartite tricarboxylate transporter substrate binding protein [Polaromonas sp.]|uniref:Bug family tripartite tricarboxylate transporter substrate binding protein n=1 Tax=Polaromonas sp. TaxID=1869339 RepID=UPI003BA90C1D
MSINRRSFSAIAAVTLAQTSAWAQQEWPSKPIRIIVPYPVGGNADSAARAYGEIVSAALKQPVIVDNRPGASSIIGSDAVAKAAPDGYTIGVVSDSHAINHAMAQLPKAADILGAKVPYDARKDFTPVGGMILVPLVLVTHPSVPAKNVKELVELSTKQKGVNFGTMGTGSPWFIHMHQLNNLTHGTFVDVPYKGLAPAATDLLGGQIQAMVMPIHYAQQQIRAGKLNALATLETQRHPLLPEVPTLAESGYPGLAISNYLYFVAPAGTPKAVISKLEREFNAAARQPAMKDKLGASGDPYPATSTELSARLNRDIDAYGAVIKTTIK